MMIEFCPSASKPVVVVLAADPAIEAANPVHIPKGTKAKQAEAIRNASAIGRYAVGDAHSDELVIPSTAIRWTIRPLTVPQMSAATRDAGPRPKRTEEGAVSDWWQRYLRGVADRSLVHCSHPSWGEHMVGSVFLAGLLPLSLRASICIELCQFASRISDMSAAGKARCGLPSGPVAAGVAIDAPATVGEPAEIAVGRSPHASVPKAAQ